MVMDQSDFSIFIHYNNTEYWTPAKGIWQVNFTCNSYKKPEYVVGSKRKEHIPGKTCQPGKKAKPIKLVTFHHFENDSWVSPYKNNGFSLVNVQ